MSKLPFETIKRELIVKKEAKTNEKYGKKPEDRSVEEWIRYGIVIVNKPAGPTSHQVSDYVKKILKIKKSGHSGTLDPNVTGILPITLDKAVRVVQFLLTSGKEYVCLMHLHKEVDEKDISKTARKFVGVIEQMPPVRSAVKRQLRKRSIYYFDILEISGRDVLFRVGCEAGTYIRKLCDDFGKNLKVGAHMAQLIRTKVGPFKVLDMVSLHELKDAYTLFENGDEKEIKRVILNFERAVEHLGKIYVCDGAIGSICHGSPLYAAGVSKFESEINRGDLVAVFSLKGELVGVGKADMNSKEISKKDKGTVVSEIKVFMERDVYPK